MEVFQDQFVIPFDGYNYTITNLQDLMHVHELLNTEELIRVKRKYMIYEKQKPKKKDKAANCPQTGGISTFTYLNFLISTISIAANVISNVK